MTKTAFLLIFNILASMNPFTHAQQIPSNSMKNILINEIGRHPEMLVNDLYKFIHQAAFGSEHAIKDTSYVRRWMETEIAGLDFKQKDSLMDTLSPDGKLVRINLRPYIESGYDKEILLKAFIETANSFVTSKDSFINYWQQAKELATINSFVFSGEEMDVFYSNKAKEGFPAIHHSPEYEEKYNPAYRVIDLKNLSDFAKESP